MKFEHHIFVCTNHKGKGKHCCSEEKGLELVAKFREVLKEKGLRGDVRAQRAGCLDACSDGPALVIYPEGTYYGNVKVKDVEHIVKKHIIDGKKVKKLAV